MPTLVLLATDSVNAVLVKSTLRKQAPTIVSATMGITWTPTETASSVARLV